MEEGLIRPVKRRIDPDVGPDAIVVITPADLDFLLEATRSRNQARFDMRFFKLHLVQRKKGESFSIFGPFLGAPHAVMGMEKVIALGARRILAWGWCGSLQQDLKIGDFVIPTQSLCEEGTSAHYPIGDRAPLADEALSERIDLTLSAKRLVAKKGKVWTTDAPFRETPSKVRKYQREGILAVDMEMSALMTLAIYRSVSFAGLLVVSDELFDLTWRPGFKNPRFKEACRSAGEAVLRVIDSQDG